MVLYSKNSTTFSSHERYERIMRTLHSFRSGGCRDHDMAVELLIGFGEYESGLVDSLYPQEDSIDPLTTALRHCALCSGLLLYHCWHSNKQLLFETTESFGTLLQKLQSQPLPKTITISIPEGFAYYGLYPETYLEAAQKLYSHLKPARVVCIGLRSIGTSLAATLGAALAMRGVAVESFTVRPHGEALERRVQLSAVLQKRIIEQSDAIFALIDEGPGASGSSLSATAEALVQLGIAEHRIVFCPASKPVFSRLSCPRARERWPRHELFCGTFENSWIASGKLCAALPGGNTLDLSAGKWRSVLMPDLAKPPHVNTLLERRKYLCWDKAQFGSESELRTTLALRPNQWPLSGLYLAKFVGLGHYGRQALQRARVLADAGFGPAVENLCHGFLISRFVPGVAVQRNAVDSALLDRVGDYLAFLSHYFGQQTPTNDFDALMTMIRENVGDSMGRLWARRCDKLQKKANRFERASAVAGDGRMMPYKWIASPKGYIKLDATDHYADQFFPGCQHSGWDVCGMAVEFGLPGHQRTRLAQRVARARGDRSFAALMPLNLVGYLAFRLGYATLATRTVAEQPEISGFSHEREGIIRRLRQILASPVIE